MLASKDILFGGPAGGYTIAKSLRFRSSASAYLSRTPGAASNRKTWTWSGWVKRGTLGAAQTIIKAGSSSYVYVYFDTNDTLYYQINTGAVTGLKNTTAVYRDPSAWYHIVVQCDTTQATALNRMRLYVNGVEVTVWSTNTVSFAQNYDTDINNTVAHYLMTNSAANQYLGGYLAETYFIDGQALTPSSFGQTDTATGVWMPKAYTGTYGTNGFYLKFADASAATAAAIGKDSSPNGNNWTPFNISVSAGVTYDSMVDTPTNYDNGGNGAGNYCVSNPLDQSGATLANGNLQVTIGASGNYNCRSTFSASSGKWYWEITCGTQTSSAGMIGVTIASAPIASSSWTTANSWMYYGQGEKYNNSVGVAYGATYTTGDIIGVALDMDSGSLTFYKNGVSQGVAYNTGLTGLVLSASFSNGTSGGSQIYNVNFGQQPFTYTPPSGFKALCTQNLPTPTIGATSSTLADSYMNIALWTGNATNNRQITGLGFQPDMVWVKSRSAAYDALILDAVRTAGKSLTPSSTSAEVTNNGNGYVSSFNSDGFTLTQGSSSIVTVNENAQTYVAWNWKANGSGTLNQQGSITSTVSANVTAGFSVVTYTGNGSASATCGHGLGVTPSMVIWKSLNSVDTWIVYHKALTTSEYLVLASTAAKATVSGLFTGISPTLLPLNNVSAAINAASQNYVAYCFAEVAGYSKFGSYVSTATADNAFVYTGFRPKWLLCKNITAGGDWILIDAARNTYNVIGEELLPNSSAAGGTYTLVDFLSNGFKVRTGTIGPGATGTYIYAAFCETPFSVNNRAR